MRSRDGAERMCEPRRSPAIHKGWATPTERWRNHGEQAYKPRRGASPITAGNWDEMARSPRIAAVPNDSARWSLLVATTLNELKLGTRESSGSQMYPGGLACEDHDETYGCSTAREPGQSVGDSGGRVTPWVALDVGRGTLGISRVQEGQHRKVTGDDRPSVLPEKPRELLKRLATWPCQRPLMSLEAAPASRSRCRRL
jgi:hypothetical protein